MDLKDRKPNEKNISKNKHFIYSLDFAITGLKTAFKDERNFRFHYPLTSFLTLGTSIKHQLLRQLDE